MPVKPHFEWEQTATEVIVTVTVKNFRKEGIDVFIGDCWVKVNAAPTYLLHLDLLHPIDVARSTFFIDIPTVRITLAKNLALMNTMLPSTSAKHHHSGIIVLPDEAEAAAAASSSGNIWETLVIDKATPREERLARRQQALTRAEQVYNVRLNTRENIKAAERKRYFQEQWELEKEQRRDIEHKIAAERSDEQDKLEQWRTGQLADEQARQQSGKKKPSTPGDVIFDDTDAGGVSAGAAFATSGGVPAVRQNPGEVKITFSAPGAAGSLNSGALPTRSRGDEDVYRKSRYKPVSVEDSPMFWKVRGDKAYTARRWAEAADAYSESIKRDGVFLTCTSNRAACYLRMHDYRRCIGDCDLAITMLGNMPASDTTQEKYRRSLIKLHARRGAAKCWSGDLAGGINDYKLATAYRMNDAEEELVRDCGAIEQYMKNNEIAESHDPLDEVRGKAHRAYYGGKYAEAIELYQAVLAQNESDLRARSNLTAALLQSNKLKEALAESECLIQQCHEVAAALQEPGAQSTTAADSDDEEGDAADDDTGAKRRSNAARTIRDNSGHVYLLLKAYVRAASACTGLKEYKLAMQYFEQAIRIAPYDNDLRDDANKVLEVARMAALVESSARVSDASRQTAATA